MIRNLMAAGHSAAGAASPGCRSPGAGILFATPFTREWETRARIPSEPENEARRGQTQERRDLSFESYVQGIRFRYLQPGQPMEPLWDTITGMPIPFEFLNTDLPEDELAMKVRLMKVYGIPKMSTLALGAIINRAVSYVPRGEMFVNVGVFHGFSYLAGLVGNPDKASVGVDNFSEFEGPREQFMANFARFKRARHAFHDGDYRDYFREVHRGRIGFYLFDGPHTYDHQLQGLQLAEPFFGDRCIVMVVDTNWDEARQGTLDFLAASPHRYRTLLDVKTYENMHPTYWNGVMVLQRE